MSEISLETPVRYVPHVGPARGELLERLEIRTVEDLLWYLPREVIDLTHVSAPRDLVEKTVQSVRGVVVDRDARQTSSGKTLTAVLIECDGEFVRGVWFNQPWMMQRMQPGQLVVFSGKPKRQGGRWEYSHPTIQWLEDDDRDASGGVLPKYGLTEGLKMHEMRRATRSAVELAGHLVAELLPEEFLRQWKLPGIQAALRGVHAPGTVEEYQEGRRRLVFDDLLEFQIAIGLKRRTLVTGQPAIRMPVSAKLDARIRRLFPFSFTAGQESAIRDVVRDLDSGRWMHRLLQADVGAGKTVVAIYAILVAIAAGHQAVIMAPTEILATQHWETINELLRESRVSRALLTGSLNPREREGVLERIRSGDVQLIVGTQSLIQEGVKFSKLGVAVIDEQHKFGVEQRARMAEENRGLHVLVMTATPIPRSLCLTKFGDLDLTVMKDLSPGRQRVVTSRILGAGARQKVWSFVREQLRTGRQLFVVCPRVDDGNRGSVAGAEQAYRELSAGDLAGFRIGLVHGQMPREEQAKVMGEFRDGDLDVLVSTTVIEVGIDVPNAVIMVVLQAERFGLSQLHQLRGRIARGKSVGYCFLFTESETPAATTRLHALEESADGFRIAELDFELRGPGDILGTRQHGELPLRLADLVDDQAILQEANEAARKLIESAEIDQAAYASLKIRVMERFGKLMDLVQTG